YTEIESKSASAVHFLAINHRRQALADASARRAIAYALDRQALLDRHFRSAAMKGKYHATANGLLPRESWASAPAPRVPVELFDMDKARSAARKAKPDCTNEWIVKYATGDPRVKAVCEEMANSIAAL